MIIRIRGASRKRERGFSGCALYTTRLFLPRGRSPAAESCLRFSAAALYLPRREVA